MRSRKLLALFFCLITFPAIAGYMTLLGAGVGNISPTVSWVAGTDTFPDTSLTYSGPSLSTMFDSTGKLTYKPNNLLTYSNTFSNAAWTKSTVTITSGVTDPLGGTTAFTMTATAANSSILQFPATIIGNGNYSIWARRRTGTGTVWLRNPAGADVVVTGSITGSWTQISSGTATSSGAALVLTINASGDALDVYAAVASAVTYETTPRPGDQVITTASAYYGPRIDYDPNTLAVKGLLIEEARTNLRVNYYTLGTADNATVVANNVTGIDGTTNGSTMSESAASGFQGRYDIPAARTAGVAYTQSVFLKQGTQRYAYIAISDSTPLNTFTGVFDLQLGTVTQSTARGTTTGSATIVAAPNGYFRCIVTATQSGTTGFNYIGLSNTGTPTIGSWGAPTYAGNTANNILFAGAQFEPGPFATSPIVTAAASVTRAADVVQFTGSALTALQGSAWSAIVETGALAGITAGSTGILGLNASQSAMYVGSATQLASFNGSSGRTATIGSSGNFTTGSVRSAIATDASGRTIVANGGTVSTDGNKAAPTAVTSANLGALNGGTFPINGPVKSFAIYNQRLPDATLQAKSVVGASYAANDNGIRYAFADNDNLPIHWRVAL